MLPLKQFQCFCLILTDDGPLSSFQIQERSSSASSFYAFLLQVINILLIIINSYFICHSLQKYHLRILSDLWQPDRFSHGFDNKEFQKYSGTTTSDCTRHFSNWCDIYYKVVKVVRGNQSINVSIDLQMLLVANTLFPSLLIKHTPSALSLSISLCAV